MKSVNVMWARQYISIFALAFLLSAAPAFAQRRMFQNANAGGGRQQNKAQQQAQNKAQRQAQNKAQRQHEKQMERERQKAARQAQNQQARNQPRALRADEAHPGD